MSFFDGKRAVVTGGASGIGLEMAAALITRGARVLVADIDAQRVEAAAAGLGDAATAARCDVRSRADVEALADGASRTMGGVDMVFANAGVALTGPAIDATPAAFEWVFGVNVLGGWNTASVFAARWRDAGQCGVLCFTASEHALGMQHAGMGLYTATKHALLGLADVLRVELQAVAQVSVLCPGLTATDLHQSKRHSDLAPDTPRSAEFAAAVYARGVPASRIAAQALDAVAAGKFLIVTHPSSRDAAEARARLVGAAFDEQAPWTPEAATFAPEAVMALVRAEIRGQAVASGALLRPSGVQSQPGD